MDSPILPALESAMPAILGLLGALVGAGASILTTKLMNDNERELRKQEDERTRKTRSDDFQRENYLQLQDVISECSRNVGSMYFWRKASCQDDGLGNWSYPQDLDEESLRLGALVSKLASRSLCDEVRELSQTYVSAKNNVLLALGTDERESDLAEFLEVRDKLTEAVGRELRAVL